MAGAGPADGWPGMDIGVPLSDFGVFGGAGGGPFEGAGGPEGVPADGAVLARNLQALSRSSAETVQAVETALPLREAVFEIAPDGGLTGALGTGPGARRLASGRRPLEEAARLAGRFEASEAGVAVVLGFGVGHHVRLLAEKLGRAGVVLVYEPDAALLRAVLERVDLSDVFERCNVAVLTRAEPGAIGAALRGAEVAVSLGAKMLEHGPSGPRLGAGAAAFGEALTTAVRAIRANVVTTLMQTETSLRNGLMNLDFYASAPGIGELSGIAAGRPAVVVSAGPSLARNMRLLAEPGVRDRVVIVAVQTVLRQLLEAGIRPHFVTALDHHEISARFYEGLTARDVEGVTLVVEPKANPAILEAFPGAVRCVHDRMVSSLLGSGFPHDGCELDPGATVAHMAYSLARHMGCDPVVLIGQDLGFTDGQYYAPGAAIHDVWAGELNEFNTIETMEWQRIVRNRGNLHPAIDHLGRRVYTDEQMSAYLVQFVRMFEADAARGLRTIDATEGGVAKRGTEMMTLRAALAATASQGAAAELPDTAADAALRRMTSARVAGRLEELHEDVARVEALSREAAGLLREMQGAQADRSRVNGLIGRVQRVGETVRAIRPAYELVQHLNQTGQFKRFRADRLMHLDDSLSPLERQRLEIERDIVNVEWIAEAAGQLGRLLVAGAAAMRGERAKLTRDPEEHGRADPERGLEALKTRGSRRVAVMIAADPERGGLGTRRDLGEPVGGRSPLRHVLERLARAERVERVVILAQEPERIRAMVGETATLGRLRLEIERTNGHPLGERRHGVAAARAFAADCWRGGLCGMTVWDEAFDPATTSPAMERLGIDAAVIVGADWAMLDPALTDAVIDRHLEDPERRRLTFTQAAPGLSPCVLDRSLVDELAANAGRAGGFASVGGLLGYVPTSPVLDPVAKPGCVRVGPELRDLGVRLIADSAWRRELLAEALRTGDRPGVDAVRAIAWKLARRGPAHLTVELCPGRRTGGAVAQLRGDGDRPVMATGEAVRLVEDLAAARPDALLTLGGAGDPLMHPGWREVVRAARGARLAGVHVRTDLQCDTGEALELLDCGADVVSVDLLADAPETYRAMAGPARLERVMENLAAVLEARAGRVGGAMPRVWIVPRITRCDRVYEEIEPFYERWVRMAQAAVIDPLPRAVAGERIAPFPEPRLLRWRRAVGEMQVRSDGRALVRAGGGKGAADTVRDGLIEAWGRVLSARRQREELRDLLLGGAAVGGEDAPVNRAAAA